MLENDKGEQWEVKYIAYKVGLSAGWKHFVFAHSLVEGDVLIFQLVESTKFKVAYISVHLSFSPYIHIHIFIIIIRRILFL